MSVCRLMLPMLRARLPPGSEPSELFRKFVFLCVFVLLPVCTVLTWNNHRRVFCIVMTLLGSNGLFYEEMFFLASALCMIFLRSVYIMHVLMTWRQHFNLGFLHLQYLKNKHKHAHSQTLVHFVDQMWQLIVALTEKHQCDTDQRWYQSWGHRLTNIGTKSLSNNGTNPVCIS